MAQLRLSPTNYREDLREQYIELLNQLRFEEMLAFCEQARFEAELEDDPATAAVALIGISYAHYVSGNFVNAEESGQSALALARQSDDRRVLCDALCNVGHFEIQVQGLHNSGQKKLEEALEIAHDIGFPRAIASAYQGIGTCYLHRMQMPKALKYLEEAVRFADDPRSRAFAYNSLANYYLNHRQPYKGKAFYEKAAELCRASGDRLNEIMMLCNSGITELRTGGLTAYRTAFERFEKALHLAETGNFAYGEITALHAMGMAYRQILEYEKALPLLQRALTLAQTREIRHLQGVAQGELIECYTGLKQYDAAVEACRDLIDHLRQAENHFFISDRTFRLGMIYRQAGKFAEAYTCYHQAIALCLQHKLWSRGLLFMTMDAWWTIMDLPRIVLYKLRGKPA
jgi:tetratricopeptide (TPR) repeat protein